VGVELLVPKNAMDRPENCSASAISGAGRVHPGGTDVLMNGAVGACDERARRGMAERAGVDVIRPGVRRTRIALRGLVNFSHGETSKSIICSATE
jgi:hypothetical protein